MIVKLIRHNFPDRPDWLIIEETVPLGTRYEVIGYDRELMISNSLLKEVRAIEAYLVSGNNGMGWLPTICFETVREES